MFMLMAGGGMRGGQVIGESDADGAAPRHQPIAPDDVAASFYHSLGIDPRMEFHTATGRPITLVRDGEIIPQLFHDASPSVGASHNPPFPDRSGR